MLAASLYSSAKLSLGQAADLAGLSKRSFAEVLGSFNISLFNYSAEELAQDVRNG
jgi:predicted HTH domain antitoxin